MAMINTDNDLFVLTSLILLIILIFLGSFLVGPCYDPAIEKIVAQLQEIPKVATQLVKPKAHRAPRPAQPAVVFPPSTATPTASPTPEGGGLRKIVFSSNRGDRHYYQIYIMDADGSHVERLTHSPSYDRDPHFASNGRDIVFASNRDEGVYQIFQLDLDTRGFRQLTHGPGDKTNPVWSPDNRFILYTMHDGRSAQLGIMNADGSDPHQLTSNYGDNHGYSFSPDGNTIAYGSSRNNRDELFTMNLKTKEELLFLGSDDITGKRKPMFSPRGHLLAFISDQQEHKIHQLYLYNLFTKDCFPLTNDRTDHNTPFISPDGTKIAYTALWNNTWNIFTMDIDGRNIRNLTQSSTDNFSPTWR
jgi:Tol biopolymer transport system component